MNKEIDNPTTDLGLVSLVKIPEKGIFRSSRSFTCPPGFYYCVFKNTSAGPEFIQNYGANQQGKLESDQDIYRVSIGGAPTRYEFKNSFSMLDGTVIDIDFELNIKIADGIKVARWVVEGKTDPIKRFEQAVLSLIDDDLASLEYSKVFIAKTKEIKLNNREFEEKVKQNLKAAEYGITLDALRIKMTLPADLKKKWEDDIAIWHTSTINPENIERRKQELLLKKEIAGLDLEENKLGIELDRDLEKLKQEQESIKGQREWQKEDETLERERKIRREEENERQSELRRETENNIDVRNLENKANLDQQTTEQRHEIRLEAERKIHERNQEIESLRHQVSSNTMKDQLEHSRRKQEEIEKIHQIRLQKLEELAQLEVQELQAFQKLKISKLENEQKLLLTTSDQDALLDYKGREADQEIRVDRARLENQELHEERLARIELGKELVRARLAIIDRLSTGESKFTPEQIMTLIGIDPMNERVIKTEKIAEIVEAMDDYLSSDNGSQKIRNVLDQLSGPEHKTLDSKSINGQLESPKPPPHEAIADDEIAFTTYYPEEIAVEKSYSMLVYAHVPFLWKEVRRNAQFFAEEMGEQKESNSSTPTGRLKRGTEITVVPNVAGVTFNPERSNVNWVEDIERIQFRLRADPSKMNTRVDGSVNIFVGPIIVASLNVSIKINETTMDSTSESRGEEIAQMYHQDEIFISYSHADTDIVTKCKEAYQALGFTVLIDSDTLRSGQSWNDELKKMIEQAKIFQLFWSENSKKSKSVKKEWQHALQCKKAVGFIRPVYWDKPLPEPPNDLSDIHFQYMPFDK